uniref:Uncharacterized protein n=1 Tax=Marseillevirus LCMAC202 TaxID=2506606 RepID=A0A481YZ28_9VIRU|nr:MAG: hypothetical protein LCMAC202_04470 [Marseillevirus LCMAC202]
MKKIQFSISNIDNVHPKVNSKERLQELLRLIAEFTIENNLYREENKFHNFTRKELATITRYLRAGISSLYSDCPTAIDGYCFLYKPNIPDGLVKIISDDYSNPKWTFWKNKDGTIEFEYS